MTNGGKMEFNHYTVMKHEAVDMLQITEERQDKIYVDATWAEEVTVNLSCKN